MIKKSIAMVEFIYWISKMSIAMVECIRVDVAGLVRSHMNGWLPFESTTEKTTETMPPSHKKITAAAMTTNRITRLRELLHYRG